MFSKIPSLFGLEVNEEFKLDTLTWEWFKFRITESDFEYMCDRDDGHIHGWHHCSIHVLEELLKENYHVVKLHA